MLQLKKIIIRKYFKSNMFSDCCYSVNLFLLNRTRHATSPTNILMRVGWILLKDSWISSAQLKINHKSVTSVGKASVIYAILIFICIAWVKKNTTLVMSVKKFNPVNKSEDTAYPHKRETLHLSVWEAFSDPLNLWRNKNSCRRCPQSYISISTRTTIWKFQKDIWSLWSNKKALCKNAQ